MLALRNRPIAAFSGPFWFSAFCAAFTPTAVGYQDLARLLVRPGVSERWRDHLIASPFGTIHDVTFSFSRPIGTQMPEPVDVQSINFNPRALDVKVWLGSEPTLARPVLQIEYPAVNRRLKGDRMPLPSSIPASSGSESLPPLQPVTAPSPPPALPPATFIGPRPKSAGEPQIDPPHVQTATPAATVASLPAASAREDDEDDDAAMIDRPPEIPAGDGNQLEAPPSPFATLSFLEEDAAERSAQLYFNSGAMGSRGGLEQWAPGAAPVLVSPPVDPDLKLSALQTPAEAGPGGETVAGKDNMFKSPAERLGLAGKARARAEKCLADAVYFEARGEPQRGQMAVAQVVMNRVFSGFYPNNVCGVVYQNADRHLACQFTFACEGKDLSRIDEVDMWEQAKSIAKDTLDGKIWLTEVGHATHYHAYWVHPSWVHEMKRMYKLGVHTFYRPRAWGDGSDAPVWAAVPGAPKPPGEEAPAAAREPPAAKSPDAAAKGPEAAVSPEAGAGKNPRTAKL
jgi:cell wall hydrolase